MVDLHGGWVYEDILSQGLYLLWQLAQNSTDIWKKAMVKYMVDLV